jgi:hypothetical protein
VLFAVGRDRQQPRADSVHSVQWPGEHRWIQLLGSQARAERRHACRAAIHYVRQIYRGLVLAPSVAAYPSLLSHDHLDILYGLRHRGLARNATEWGEEVIVPARDDHWREPRGLVVPPRI